MDKKKSILPALRRAGSLIACEVLLVALASGVQAQTPQRGPQSIEIAGVRLGMPREQAIKALMANQPPLVDDDGWSGKSSAVPLKVPALSADPFVWRMEFRAKPSAEDRDAPYDKMELEFAPPPSESIVLTLSRHVSFDGKAKARAPTAANFLDAITEKFGPSASSINRGEVSGGREQNRTYVWTRTGELLTEREYQGRKDYSYRCRVASTGGARSDNNINFRAFEGLRQKDVVDSCAVVASISWSQDPKGIMKHFIITIADRAGILTAFTKSAEVVEGTTNQQRQQELDRATKNRTKL